MSDRFIQVALPVPLHGLFTYRMRPGDHAAVGTRVRVQFGPRRLVGVVARPEVPTCPPEAVGRTIRYVLAVLDDEPLLGPELMALAEWVSSYYLSPPGEAYGLLLPPRMAGDRRGQVAPWRPKSVSWAVPVDGAPAPARPLGPKMRVAWEWIQDHGEAPTRAVTEATGADGQVLRRLAARGLITLQDRAQDRVVTALVAQDAGVTLTEEQEVAVDAVLAALGGYQGFLLHGVTGSGKTEVYLRALAATLARGQGAIVLVPEIALTPQLVGRFRARLGDRVAVQHSGLSPEARQEQWLRIAAGELAVVVGARSAIFAPVPDLGLIVVDEEHEATFKQDVSPRYHARDLALVRGASQGVPVVLGSATPSGESWANVARDKLTYLRMARRALARPMPPVDVVDLRASPPDAASGMFSAPLVAAIEDALAAGHQAILFLNRRGYATFVLCQACGQSLGCPSCSVTLTWHQRRGRLVCHLCDYRAPRPSACPQCRTEDLADVGFGTEQVEAAVVARFPKARVARMDRDTTRGRGLERLLNAVRSRQIDILIGTQMVAKGHDFPFVTLVGVLLAEQGLAIPDIRASERTFQLLTQIAGRAGRADQAGRVVVQTYWPDNPPIRFALQHDTVGFLAHELRLRQARGLPPHAHLVLLRVSGKDAARVQSTARALSQRLADSAQRRNLAVAVHPAQPALIERVKERTRYQILLRGPARGPLRALLNSVTDQWKDGGPTPGVQIAVDVDPMSLM